MANTTEIQRYDLGDFALKSGTTLPKAFLGYKTYGNSSNPLIIFPTSYSLAIEDNEWLIGDGRPALDTKKYFIVVIALFGNGQSTSPSNRPDLKPFPDITFYDNIKAQHELITKGLGIAHARAVMGWSMGGGQTFQWATQYPDFMDLAIPYCGSAKTSLHNQVFLEGVKVALLSAKGSASAGICAGEIIPNGTEYRNWTPSEKEIGLKALARVYAGWGFSQPFYRQKIYETAPAFKFKNLEDFMVSFWEAWGLSKDPENMLTMLHSWQAGDVSDQPPYNGNFDAAMKGIKAKILVLPCKTDLYFPPEDSEIEVAAMRPGVGELAVFPSIWGHWAGGPGQSEDDAVWLQDKLRKHLDSV